MYFNIVLNITLYKINFNKNIIYYIILFIDC